jgi:hypothetical protein
MHLLPETRAEYLDDPVSPMKRAFLAAIGLVIVATLAGVLAFSPRARGADVVTGLTPSPTPAGPGGRRAVIDLPTQLHMRNTGGSDGAGLCVGTSVEMAARWHGIHVLDGFQAWLKRRPGGSYPSKLTADLKAFCASKGVPVPPHVQTTGGDVSLLDAAFATRRMVCMTWL